MLDLAPVRPASPVALSPSPAAARFVLRGRDAAVAAVTGPLGVPLPQYACRAVTSGPRAALWLGPDEWLILAPEADGPGLQQALEDALHELPHALVDVGHRQTGLDLAGAEAATVLNAGCPLDLDPEFFPVGRCTRTVLGKAEIVLWRTGPAAFRIEVWRSFAPYLRQFLEEASREFRA